MRELNFAVQRTIDRLIFLRICEDRGIEDYGRLQAALERRERIYGGSAPSSARRTTATTPACFISARRRDARRTPDTVHPSP